MVTHPSKSLNEPSKPVQSFGSELEKFAEEMNETMIRENGIGLAAPQIGRNIRFIIVKAGESKKYKTYANPVITFRSAKKVAIEEGCLSVPGVFGYVERAAKIRFQYMDSEGKKHAAKAKGMEAIVLQHEIDHIEGRLIINCSIQLTKGAELLDKKH